MPKRAKSVDEKLADFRVKESLINAVKLRPTLYDKSDPAYSKVNLIEAAWQEVAAEVERDVQWCRQEWNRLRRNFRNHEAKLATQKASGSGQIKRKTKGFEFAEQMEFLKDSVHRRRKTKSNIATKRSSDSSGTDDNTDDEYQKGTNGVHGSGEDGEDGDDDERINDGDDVETRDDAGGIQDDADSQDSIDGAEETQGKSLKPPLGLNPDEESFLAQLSDIQIPDLVSDNSVPTSPATLPAPKPNRVRRRRRRIIGSEDSPETQPEGPQKETQKEPPLKKQKTKPTDTQKRITRKRKRSNSFQGEHRFLKSATEAAEMIAETAGRNKPEKENETNDHKLTKPFCDTLYYYIIQLPTQKRLKLQSKLFEETSSTVMRELGDTIDLD